MNTTTACRRTTTSRRVRRLGSLTVAGAAVCLALAPAVAHASQIPPDTTVPATAHASDIDYVVSVRKQQMAAERAGTPSPAAVVVARARLTGRDFVVIPYRTGPAEGPTCLIPETLDSWSRRLIAIQDCGKSFVVPALYVARAPYGMPAPLAVGHCGHEGLHQSSSSFGLPVSAWYTPTSC